MLERVFHHVRPTHPGSQRIASTPFWPANGLISPTEQATFAVPAKELDGATSMLRAAWFIVLEQLRLPPDLATVPTGHLADARWDQIASPWWVCGELRIFWTPSGVNVAARHCAAKAANSRSIWSEEPRGARQGFVSPLDEEPSKGPNGTSSCPMEIRTLRGRCLLRTGGAVSQSGPVSPSRWRTSQWRVDVEHIPDFRQIHGAPRRQDAE
jgi:hypothetical protein